MLYWIHDLEHVERDDADEHEREYKEHPRGRELGYIMWAIEPQHQQREADGDGKANVDPKQYVGEIGPYIVRHLVIIYSSDEEGCI